MKFNYPETKNSNYGFCYLPILTDDEKATVNLAVAHLSMGATDEQVCRDLYNILMDCGCTSEKDSVFDYVASIVEIMFYYDSRKESMLKTLESAVYQCF